ncbi:MAG: hypothetical protein II350_08645, partial [Clostridia bacterium]|nr:hypothetical protein [Clostridia bacterium]
PSLTIRTVSPSESSTSASAIPYNSPPGPPAQILDRLYLPSAVLWRIYVGAAPNFTDVKTYV